MKKYTKTELEMLILSQLDTIDVAQEQLRLMRERNDLLEKENRELKSKLFPVKLYNKVMKRKPGKKDVQNACSKLREL